MGNLDNFNWDADQQGKKPQPVKSLLDGTDWEHEFFKAYHRFPDDQDELDEFIYDAECEEEANYEEEEECYSNDSHCGDPYCTLCNLSDSEEEKEDEDPIESIIRNGDKQAREFRNEPRPEPYPPVKKDLIVLQLKPKSVNFEPKKPEVAEEGGNSWDRPTNYPKKARTTRGLNFRVKDV